MFRQMRRINQQLSNDECVKLLTESKRGVLSLIIEDGYPYGIPMDHWYNPENGHIYFHGAKEGQKADALKENDKVSYCVMCETGQEENSWIKNYRSVVVFGRMQLVEDREMTVKACTGICKKFTEDEDYLKQELDKALSRVQCFELIPEQMTGKRVKES